MSKVPTYPGRVGDMVFLVYCICEIFVLGLGGWCLVLDGGVGRCGFVLFVL